MTYRSDSLPGPLQTKAEHYAARLLAAIQEDIASGIVPAHVRSFADINDYVDAADYDGAVGWSVTDEPEMFDEAIRIVDCLLPAYADLAAGRTAPLLPARVARVTPEWPAPKRLICSACLAEVTPDSTEATGYTHCDPSAVYSHAAQRLI